MAENNLNHVFLKPADERRDETGAEAKRFKHELAEKMICGPNFPTWSETAILSRPWKSFTGTAGFPGFTNYSIKSRGDCAADVNRLFIRKRV